VVEDNKFSLQWVTTVLKQLKVNYEIAEDGAHAVKIFEKHMRDGILFDMILMDLIMPVKNGYLATQEIREIEQKYSLTGKQKHFICGFSAEVNPEVITKCHAHGMDNIL